MKKYLWTGITLAVVLLSAVPTPSTADPGASPSTQAVELLKNPGFEGLVCRGGSVPPECLDNWSNDACHDGTFHGNIFTPQGWITWWRKDSGYGQPEVKTIPNVPPFTGELPRIHGGHYAVLLFTFYRLQEVGLYQVVTGLQPGSTVQLSAWSHGWSCDDPNARLGFSCGDPYNMSFQVGIEPNGAADPFSPNIVWSGEYYNLDRYAPVGPVTAQVGPGGSVTAVLRSKSKWAFRYLDAYWDDASMVMVSPGAPPTSAPPPPPTQGPPPPPRNTATPRPDGSVVHTVRSGDTIFGIALSYGVSADQIRQLNAGSVDGDIIHVGQELVIALPSVTATPTLEPTAPPPDQGGETGGGSVVTGPSICVLAYHDRNGDTFRDVTNEELLPNAQITLADASGVINQYTTNGLSEPYCFTGIAVGTYRAIQNPPPGYAPSGPAEWAVQVPTEDTRLDVSFGNARGEGVAEGGDTTTPTSPEGDDTEPITSLGLLSTLAKVGGVLVLILAAGMGAFIVVNRNRL